VKTLLVDRYRFPRDKVCGDALIPDALQALHSLGLERAVSARARSLDGIRVHAPNGRSVSIAGRCACLPRREFDELLRDSAIAAGAAFMAPLNITGPIGVDRVAGATLEDRETKTTVTVRARITVLATGAVVEGLNRFQMTTRAAPSAIALRAYYKVPRDLSRSFDHLCISYDRSVMPGYGWIFPGPDDVFNVGIGWFLDSGRTARPPDVRDVWQKFTTRFPPAAELVRVSEQVSPLRGAPIRAGFTGSRLHRPGLIVAGEAAGLTYSFSGEGIGKAMASGIIAADRIVDCLNGRLAEADLGAVFEAQLRTFESRFRAYRSAQRWLSSATFANVLAARASRGSFVREQLEGLFNETTDPRALFSLSGLLRSIVR